jgi:nucleotide-binding universal stress UspA family protein
MSGGCADPVPGRCWKWNSERPGKEEEIMFDRIIVPLDGSTLSAQIVPYATALARGIQAPVRLLHVVEPEAAYALVDPEHGFYLDHAMECQKAWAQLYLRRIQAVIDAGGVESEMDVVFGDTEEEILRAAATDGSDLVAMATHGRTGLRRWVVGSVADRVLHHGRTPLLLFRPREETSIEMVAPHTIVVPLDGSAMAEQALPVAEYLGRALKSRLELLRVVPARLLMPAASVAVYPAAAGADLGHDEIAQARRYLDGWLRALAARGTRAEARIEQGDRQARILDVAREDPHTLIVTGTHARAGLRRMVRGSVAEDLVRAGGSPVLIVHNEA